MAAMVKTIAAISLVYDVSVGVALSLLRHQFQDVFGVRVERLQIRAGSFCLAVRSSFSFFVRRS